MGRPSQPLISRDAAFRAALTVIDREGLEAFSVARLAEEMNVKVPSLYHHFRHKGEILAGVARLIMVEADDLKRWPRGPWKEVFENLTVSAWRAMVRHRNAMPLIFQFPPRSVVLGSYERNINVLEKKGVPRHQILRLLQGMDSILMGAAFVAASADPDSTGVFPAFDPHAFPALAAVAGASDMNHEDLLRATMRTFMDGVSPDLPEENAVTAGAEVA